MPLSFRHFLPSSMQCRSITRMRWWGRWLVAVALLGGSVAHAAPFAYLADRATQNLSVIDMATYATVATSPLSAAADSPPANVVANSATKKVYVGTTNSIVIFDAVTNTLVGEIPLSTGPLLFDYGTESQSLVINTAGTTGYALTAGLVSVIDLSLKTVTATLAVPANANAMVLDTAGQTLYVSTASYRGSGTVSSIVTVDTRSNTVDKSISLGILSPRHIAMHPDDNHLYIVGANTDFSLALSYTVLDTATAKLSEVAVTLPPGAESIRQFQNFVFNQDGSRLYLAPFSLNMTTIPVLEVNTADGSVVRTIAVPSGYADEHYFNKMAASFADGKFILVFFILEHLHHYPAEPPRRVVFVDGVDGTVVQQLVYPPSQYTPIVGDILDSTPTAPLIGKTETTTTLHASTNPPLRPNIALVLNATVSGRNPTGNVTFEFAAVKSHARLHAIPHLSKHALSITTAKVRQPITNGATSLALPACDASWTDLALQHVVCSKRFVVAAVYQGDARNKKSVSAILLETR